MPDTACLAIVIVHSRANRFAEYPAVSGPEFLRRLLTRETVCPILQARRPETPRARCTG